MKIGLVLDDTLDTPDGVQQYVLRVGEWLSTQGHEVRYLVGATERTDIPGIHSLSRNMHVKFNGNRMSMPLPASRRKLRAFLAEEQFDVLHVQVPYSPFMAGRLLSVTPRSTAVIGTFHILPYSKLVTVANHILAALNRRSGRRFDEMLAVSDPARVFARRVYGYDAKVVPNPIDVACFTVSATTNDVPVIAFLGRLVERKGVQYLVRAIDYVRSHGLYDQPFRVEIAGKGELLASLERFVTQRSLKDIVTFRGFISESDKPAFLAQADIAVYPSTGGESFGIVLLEAFAAARGVVLAGNNPGYASVMEPYPNQLFEPRDVPRLAALIAAYLKDAPNREQAAKSQKEYVQQFDINIVGSKLTTIYTEVLQSRRQS